MSKKGGAAASAAVSVVKLLVPAGKASAQPPVGPALGAKGVKAMDFAKLFNEKTALYEPGVPIPTVVTIAPDRTFTFTTNTPPVSHLLKRCAGISTGSGRAGAESAGIISAKHIYEIAKIKMQDVSGVGEEQMARMIVGQARSMGLRVIR
ncbi:mitochondrial 54S ribosomal protein YmL19 [Tilletia horrida]|uniref:Large ribosomal subunit protein uL11m n=1 Tax=Tilletia horrida TaxID=155126 RepID=A0AAN6JPF7_9BASI|nr:mitochondrial 54S ribosomal protein YmL19 [Tilletia horrida]